MNTSFIDAMPTDIGECKEAYDLIMSYLDQSSDKQINILFAGATGSGKSTFLKSLIRLEAVKKAARVFDKTLKLRFDEDEFYFMADMI